MTSLVGSLLGGAVPAAVAAAMWKTHRQTQRQIRIQTERACADAHVHRCEVERAAREIADRGTERIDCLEIWFRLPARIPPHERHVT